jgi:WD40 repeat protein
MRRLWRWTGGSEIGRRVLLVMAVAGLWLAWMIIPASPAISWSCAARQPDYFELSPDGGTIVQTAQLALDEIVSSSICRAGPARVCDAATGRPRYELFNHDDMSARITGFAPDGSWLLVEEEAGHSARILDSAEGRELARFPGETHWAWSITRSPDGRELALTPPRGSDVQLWDIATKKVRAVLPGARRVVAYSPDGRRLATAWWDKPDEWAAPDRRLTIRIWDVATGRELARREIPAVATADCQFSPDGRWLAALSESLRPTKPSESMWFGQFAPETNVPGSVTVWDVTTGAEMTLFEFSDSSQFERIAFTEDSGWFFVRTRTGPYFWDLHSPPARRTMLANIPSTGYYPFLIPHTDRMIVHGDDPDALELWSTADMTRRAVCRLRLPKPTAQFATAADGSSLAVLLGCNAPMFPRVAGFFNKYLGVPMTFHCSCVVQRFDTVTGAEQAVLNQDGEGGLLGFSPDGATLWTSAFVADSADGKSGVAVIRGWMRPSPWPPVWLLAVTAFGLLLLGVDLHRGRRATPRAA